MKAAGYFNEDGDYITSDCTSLLFKEGREQYHECEDKFALEECTNSASISTKDYPIEGTKAAFANLKYLYKSDMSDLCMKSKVRLWCYAGSCQLVADSGDYGFYPNKVNRLKVGNKVWTWVGDQPRSIGHEMWKETVDGVVVAGELVHWPYDSLVTFSQKIFVPAGLKEKVYRRSLEKP